MMILSGQEGNFLKTKHRIARDPVSSSPRPRDRLAATLRLPLYQPTRRPQLRRGLQQVVDEIANSEFVVLMTTFTIWIDR